MRRLPPLLRQAWFSLNQAFRPRVAPLGITPDQHSILRWLQESQPEGLTQVEITERMSSDPNTITATVRRMEAAGLITRTRDARDARAKRVQIAPRGSEILALSQVRALELQEAVLATLSAQEREQFLELLERIANACSEEASNARRASHAPQSR